MALAAAFRLSTTPTLSLSAATAASSAGAATAAEKVDTLLRPRVRRPRPTGPPRPARSSTAAPRARISRSLLRRSARQDGPALRRAGKDILLNPADLLFGVDLHQLRDLLHELLHRRLLLHQHFLGLELQLVRALAPLHLERRTVFLPLLLVPLGLDRPTAERSLVAPVACTRRGTGGRRGPLRRGRRRWARWNAPRG